MKFYRHSWLLCLIFCPLVGFAQPAAFAIYSAEGKPQSFAEMVEACAKADVVLFGELHNHPVAHWLQLELAQALHQKNPQLLLGAEMFEADDQEVLDEYFAGHIAQRNFEEEVKLWDNYATDYKPLLEWARENGLHYVATNVPRRYAATMARKGIDSLQAFGNANYMAPLPFAYSDTIPGYAPLAEMAGMHGAGMPQMPFLAQSQALKDATMAHFILENLPESGVFLHLNGDYHSAEYGGIYWYLKHARPELEVVTLRFVEAGQPLRLPVDAQGTGTFVLVAPQNFPKSY